MLTADKLKVVATMVCIVKTSIPVDSLLSLFQIFKMLFATHKGFINNPTEKSAKLIDAINAFDTVLWVGTL